MDYTKKYKSGTYNELSTKDRMFYVDYLKEHSNSSTLFEPDWIRENLHMFFSDACRDILEKTESSSEFICPDFTEDDEYGDQVIAFIRYSEPSDQIEILMEYDQSTEYLYFDYKLLDEKYLDGLL